MLTVHHLNNSRSQRVLWLCDELGLEYTLVKHQRHPETQRSPESLCKLHPLGKSPVIDHDGLLIVETEAIMEYICHTFADGRLSRSPGSKDYGAYLQWLAFSEGTAFPPLLVDLIYAWTGGGNEAFKGFYDVELEKNLKYVESSLAGQDYILASGFSAADINLGWTLEFAECRGRLRNYAGLRAYLARLRAREGYKTALKRGGEQDLSVFAAGVN
ncbi:glutathione S-transferase [Methylibium sp.]|uniref:glutathione S-transferase family protein n=1 Tax=Methylibium sp. TaxID=2067992 RepID=UPI00286B1CD1|nr:glutathione S-transferase [Methylibium sp.]